MTVNNKYHIWNEYNKKRQQGTYIKIILLIQFLINNKYQWEACRVTQKNVIKLGRK